MFQGIPPIQAAPCPFLIRGAPMQYPPGSSKVQAPSCTCGDQLSSPAYIYGHPLGTWLIRGAEASAGHPILHHRDPYLNYGPAPIYSEPHPNQSAHLLSSSQDINRCNCSNPRPELNYPIHAYGNYPMVFATKYHAHPHPHNSEYRYQHPRNQVPLHRFQ